MNILIDINLVFLNIVFRYLSIVMIFIYKSFIKNYDIMIEFDKILEYDKINN